MARSMSQIEQNQTTSKSESRGTLVASLAAVGSVIAASSCCLPLLPFLFAAGAAGTSAFVARWRPYLLVLSVLLIAFGFYKSWRTKQCNCKPSWISTLLLWFSALVAFGVVYYFYGGHTTPKGQPPLVSFSSGDLTPLKTAFNGSASSSRVVVM